MTGQEDQQTDALTDSSVLLAAMLLALRQATPSRSDLESELGPNAAVSRRLASAVCRHSRRQRGKSARFLSLPNRTVRAELG
ncbi:hypothetical protein M8818_004517 [Zalaria obscura]|uniref:Uncharacterized protein n=1 Tax=Zalaria obscura TaxID=2024903 RepID=A0ACC3SC23_9PEZI